MKRITFLVGPNGCGKTKRLVNTASSTSRWPHKTAAIANTPFVRFGRNNKNRKVFKVSPSGIKRVVTHNLRNLFSFEGRSVFDIADLLDIIGFRRSVEIEIKLADYQGFDLSQITSDEIEIDAISSTLDSLRRARGGRFDLSGYADSFSRSLRDRNLVLFRYIEELKRAKIVSSYSLIFHHTRRGDQVFFELSSGEQTLISTFLFIRSTLSELDTIFIDEPENSLHPEWQRRYLEFIHMALGYHEAKIYLATHSPVLVSGAISSYEEEVEVIRVNGEKEHLVEISQNDGPESVEEILWEAFETITPVNHFLSLELSRILQDLTDGRIKLSDAEEKIDQFRIRSFDPKQKQLLDRVAKNISRFSPNA